MNIKLALKNIKRYNKLSDIINFQEYISRTWISHKFERSYSKLIFNEVFIKVLGQYMNGEFLEGLFLNRIRFNYMKTYDGYNNVSSNIEIDHDDDDSVNEDINLVNLKFQTDKISRSDYIRLFDLISNKKELTNKDSRILSSIKLKKRLRDEDLLSLIDGMNLYNLFLINEMGLKKFLEFSSLMSSYSLIPVEFKIKDEEISRELATNLINSLVDKLEFNDIAYIDKLENLIIK